jgi:flagellar hook assembly protein FlgD
MRNEGLEMKRDLSYSLTWNGTNDAGNPVASGVYYARLAVGGMHLAQTKMLLLQ